MNFLIHSMNYWSISRILLIYQKTLQFHQLNTSKHLYTGGNFLFKIYPENMVVVG